MNENADQPKTDTAKSCPRCGGALPAGTLEGLCPGCLLDQGAETATGAKPGTPRFEALAPDAVAALFPNLEILGLIGAGGMGAVYRARQPALDRLVALKLLPAQGAGGGNFAERFTREARALARLNHPNIVAVHEFGQVGGLPFFIMEFVDGANLRQLEKAGRLSPREALQVIPQICDALQYAHDQGVVHRDIKPENVLVDRKGRVKIADFGLAKILGVDADALRLTAEGQVMGTPHYMAPEQVENPLTVDHRADIYSLGVVFYEMLTGDLPLGKFPPPSRKVQVDVRLDAVVLRALENDPERRYQQASEVKQRVATIAETPAPAAPAFPQARYVHWEGFPVVVERDGQRKVNWEPTIRAWALLLGLLTVGFGMVSLVTGRSLIGWVGVMGWPSLAARFQIATLIVGWGVWRALNAQDRLATSATGEGWWRGRATAGLALLCVAVLAVAGSQRSGLDPIKGSGNQLAAKLEAANALPSRSPGDRTAERPKTFKDPPQHVASLNGTAGALKATLPDGGTVELLGIGEPEAAPAGWWRADGMPVQGATYQVRDICEVREDPAERQRDLIFRFTDSPQGDAGPVFAFDPPARTGAGGVALRDGQELLGGWPIRVAWAKELASAQVRVGFGLSEWKIVSRHEPLSGSGSLARTRGKPDWDIAFHRAVDALNGTQVTYVFGEEDPNWQRRAVAVDKNGGLHSHTAEDRSISGTTSLCTYTFWKTELESIQEVRLEMRPIRWIEFRDLSLQPKVPVPAPRPARFGPAQEFTFNALLDLDTGRTGEFPEAKPGQNPFAGLDESIAWMQEQGFDVEARADALGAVGTTIAYLDARDWDTMTPGRLGYCLRNLGRRPVRLQPLDGMLPATFGFRTREGRTGMMQVTRFGVQPPGTHLRLKHVLEPGVERTNP